jgi:hypothetical protein
MLTTQNWLNILKTPDPSLKVNKDPDAPLTQQIAAYMVGKDWLTTDDFIDHFKDYTRMQILGALHALKKAYRVEARNVETRKKNNNSFRQYRLLRNEEGYSDWIRKYLDHETGTVWAKWVGHA